MKCDKVSPIKQNQKTFTAKVVSGAARKAANHQIGDTAQPSKKSK